MKKVHFPPSCDRLLQFSERRIFWQTTNMSSNKQWCPLFWAVGFIFLCGYRSHSNRAYRGGKWMHYFHAKSFKSGRFSTFSLFLHFASFDCGSILAEIISAVSLWCKPTLQRRLSPNKWLLYSTGQMSPGAHRRVKRYLHALKDGPRNMHLVLPHQKHFFEKFSIFLSCWKVSFFFYDADQVSTSEWLILKVTIETFVFMDFLLQHLKRM